MNNFQLCWYAGGNKNHSITVTTEKGSLSFSSHAIAS